MQVFEAKNEGHMRGGRFERIVEFTQHALPGCPGDGTAQTRVTLWVEQSGHLRQPGWSIPFEDRHEIGATGLAAQSHERLEERLIRLADTIVLQTLPPGGPRAACCRDGCNCLLRDR